MRRKFIVLMSVLLIFGMFAACSSGKGGPANPASSAAGGKVVKIQIGYENNPGEPIDLAANEWKRILEEKSGGQIVVELFPSNQLGSKDEIIDQMLAGDSVITLVDGGFFSERGVPDLGILNGPYLFPTWDSVWNLIESDWWQEQSQLVEEQGLKIVTANWIYGDRHTLTKEPVRTVEDLKGMKIRVPNNNAQIKGLEVLGAVPTPMPLGEVYPALQQGVVDGLENPLPVLYNGKFHEVAKYLTLDSHIRGFTTWAAGKMFFDSLTSEQQQWLMEAGDEAGLYNNKVQEEATKEVIEMFKAEGVEIIEVDTAPFKEASESFYDLPDFSDWSPGLYETVVKAME